MSQSPSFDVAAAHRYFAAQCFNQTWEYLEKTNRSSDDDEAMVACALASIHHWRNRPDCTARNLSIGYWQVSRVYAVLHQAANAWRYAEFCLKASEHEEPFYLGYAYESLARAARIAGDESLAAQYRQKGFELAHAADNADERGMLLKDLESLI